MIKFIYSLESKEIKVIKQNELITTISGGDIVLTTGQVLDLCQQWLNNNSYL